MGIWERLGIVLKSYINDGAERVFGEDRPRYTTDDDLNAAYEELDDYLKGDQAPRGKKQAYGGRPVPPELKRDFT